MGTIQELRARVAAVRDALESGEQVRRLIENNEEYILDLNAQVQLYEQGRNAAGVSISSYRPYSPRTVAYKKARGQPYDRVTLRDTGDFHRSFAIAYEKDGFRITATDWKTAALEEKYGAEIFGLTDKNRAELIAEYISPYLTQWIKSLL